MAVSLKTLKTVTSKVNSKGASLIRKETGLKIAKAIKEGVKAPEGAKSYDAVRVGRNFKPNECYTDIFTFRDKNGEIISRVTKKVDGKNVSETKKWFEKLFPWEKDLDDIGEKVLNIPATRVRSYTRESGKIASVSEDVFAVTEEAKPYLTHYKKVIKPGSDTIYRRTNYESILLEQRRNGEKAKFIKNYYEVDKHANGGFRLIDSQTSSPELAEIAQNTYLLPYVSTKNKFPSRMTQAAIKDADFIILEPEVSLYKEVSSRRGYFSNSGNVNINLKSSRDLSRPRESLTETIAHEVGHAKWDEKVDMYEMYKLGFDEGDFLRNFSKKDIPEIVRYKKSIDNYITPSVSSKGYYEQFCEKVAREEGKKGVQKYDKLNKVLDREFPNMHGFQFYKPPVNEDDMQGLMSLINSWM
ncbi:MAG: hypothetical protein KHX03_01200 [Clostridium sp.]|nr:hypothetical protein [Clostridium sp.]